MQDIFARRVYLLSSSKLVGSMNVCYTLKIETRRVDSGLRAVHRQGIFARSFHVRLVQLNS